MAKINQDNDVEGLDSHLKRTKIRKSSQLNEKAISQDPAQKNKLLVLMNQL